MKIAFMGTQCNGKSTLIKEFCKRWPMYKEVKSTYRKLIKTGKITNNEDGTAESQRAILDAIIDDTQKAAASEDEFLVFDRCVIDNIVYSLWLNEKGKVSDEFIMDTKRIAFEAIRVFDIIFYVPLREEIKIVPRKGRAVDPVYRQEINNLFRAVVGTYEKSQGIFFPKEDCPAVITLEGPPDLRIEQIPMYIKSSGKFFDEEDGSLLADMA
jgi:thymidylate kinase